MNQIDLAAPDLGQYAALGKLAQNAQATKAFPGSTDGKKVGEPKYDGWRLIAVVRDGHVDFYSRSGKTYNVLTVIEAELLATVTADDGTVRRVFPAGTILDGEVVALVVQDGKVINEWGTTQTVMTKGGAVAEAMSAKVSYMVFDLIAHAHIDARPLPYDKRRALLERIFEAHGEQFAKVKLTPQVEPTEKSYAALLAQGFEGMVVKRRNAPYASGKREGAGWEKAKPTTTIEGVIMGFTPGKEGFTGMVGAVVFGQHGCAECGGEGYDIFAQAQGKGKSQPCPKCDGGKVLTLIERGKVSGMDMRTRLAMTKNPDQWVGKVIEIAHEGVSIGQSDTGRFRFPRMKRVRPDKDAAQVTLHDE
jgi:bifunctional non-homologous end joining protein LigD